MDIRQLTGEINGKDIINIGDMVTVTHVSGCEHIGRFNSASQEEIKVGMSTIKVEEVIKINLGDGRVNSLFNWLEDDISREEIDATLEWLFDNNMLNKKGKDFAHKVWKRVWDSPKKYGKI